MNGIAKEITLVNIEDELRKSYLDYVMSVIVGRALPDVRDGLKPVHRRILYAMSVLGNDWDKPYKKSARVVGDVIGKYHPHGDSGVYDAIVRMAQPFSLRYTLVDGQGNFGSIDGDPAAAMRYTEIHLAKISHELMADLEKDTVDFIDNYDGTEKVPDVMPTKIPNLLINGSSGIAVGMATNIPPHNINEIINGCLAFIDDEDIDISELMKYIPGPDFPTAAVINGRCGIEEAYRTGRGKICIRARSEIEIDPKTGRENIIIYEIPYQVNKAHLIERFAELVKEKQIDGISALRDESDKDGMRIVIEIKRDAVSELVLNKLYSKTQLQVSFGINMVALYRGQPKTMNLKEILKAFVDHRCEVVTRRTIFELQKSENQLRFLEAKAVALTNVNSIIDLIRCSSNFDEAVTSLLSCHWDLGEIANILECAKNNIFHSKFLKTKLNENNTTYFLTEQQAKIILNLRLQKLTSLEYSKLLNEYRELLERITELLRILENKTALMKVIRKEMETIRDQFGDERRTEIIDNNINIDIEDLINQEDVVITLSRQGYVKYQPLSDYKTQRRGGKGKSAARIKEEDFIDCLLVANTHDTILCFSNLGRLYWMKVYQLPEASRSACGRPIVNLLPLRQGERITAILPICKYKKSVNIFMATASGIVKRTSLSEFGRPRSTGIVAINLNKGDELIGVNLTSGNDEIMLFSSYGKVVRFEENSIRTMGRNAAGVRGIKLIDKSKVVSLIIPRGNGTVLTVTRNGYGKRTPIDEYPTKSRGTQGVVSIKMTERNGPVVGAVQVDDHDQIMMITNAGMLVRTRVSEISIVKRNTQGVTLFHTAPKENVVGLQCISEPITNNAIPVSC